VLSGREQAAGKCRPLCPIAAVRRIKHNALMRKFTGSTCLFVAGTALVSGGAGWFAADLAQPFRRGGSEITATVNELRSRPNDYAGKRVRLTGKIDECYHWECSLCPESMTNETREANRCLPLTFRPLVAGTGFGSTEQEGVFRFSSVMLSATFDPACLRGGCLDRQVVLEDVVVNSVTKRRAGASGLWISETTKLVRVNGALASEIEASARRSGYQREVRIRTFATSGQEPRFVVCSSSYDSGETVLGAWPATLESALYAPSTLDFFRCNEVQKVNGQMVVQADT